MQAVVRWCGWDGKGLEHCVYRCDERGLLLEGVIAGNRKGQYGACYLVRTDVALKTREVRVAFVAGPNLHLEADGRGQWRDVACNQPLPMLDGCLDVDIGMTPATNTLPIKRLGLLQEESMEIKVVYIPVLSEVDTNLFPQLADQRYTRLSSGHRYRYEGLSRSFSAELEVDEFDLVRDYPGIFRRLKI